MPNPDRQRKILKWICPWDRNYLPLSLVGQSRTLPALPGPCFQKQIMKLLLLHTPKFNNFYKPIGDFIWLNYMPSGLLAIADLVSRRGWNVEVVHLGVEWVENRSFRVDKLMKRNPEVKVVGISLHWHHQAYDVIQVARRIKAVREDVFVFLGGDTASFFHHEIVRNYPVIDAVIQGYAEISVLRLLESLNDKKDLHTIPNLTWKDGGDVRENSLNYTTDAATLNELDFTNFALLRNAETYIQYVGLPFFFAKRFTKSQNARLFTLGSPLFPVPVGRGCPFNCTWCGGSQVSQLRFISGLKGYLYRTHDSVLRSIKNALQAGYKIMHSSMDPEPYTQEYFVELWRLMRRKKINTEWMFECNGLPSDEFITEFSKTFSTKRSVIALSPECGNEKLRLSHKGPGFTTQAFLDKMDRIDSLGISSEVFFTYGLPGENEALLEETVSLQKKIFKRYKNVRAIRTLSVEMEPGAPWHLQPERFGIVTNRRSFEDFYNAHSDPDQGPFTSFGYYIPDYFEKPLDMTRPYDDFATRIQTIKCKKFCFLHPNPRKGGRPWQGRLFCHLASRLISLKPRNLSRPY